MYLYGDLIKDLMRLSARGVEIREIGYTHLGHAIPMIRLGRGGYPAVLVHASVHAREHITSKLVMALTEGFQPTHSTFYILPMVNIDGVRIATEGLNWISSEFTRRYISALTPELPLFKANARGVDINVNFTAGWGEGKGNKNYPSSSDYVGPYPESEAETQALVRLTRAVRPVLSISYHAKGEVIYWSYGSRPLYEERFLEIAGKYAESTGYELAVAEGSAGGYKDWFIEEGFGLGLTIEVGEDRFSHPYPYEDFDNVLKKNEEVFYLADEHAGKIYRDAVYGGGLP